MKQAVSIPAIMNDNKKNITQVVAEFSQRLFAFIKSRVSSDEDAEDILQDVFYQLAGNTEPVEKLSSWLFTIAKNKITDSYRKKKPKLLEEIFAGDNEDEFLWEEILFYSDDNPETEYLRNIFWETLQNALDELPAEQKNAFVLHELEDISFEEMSERTGIAAATLISRKRYAVLHLRERLQIVKDELLNY